MAEKGTSYFAAAVLFVACSASAESDFDEYVASIRQSGMSEMAAGDVRGTANILSGGGTFRAMPMPDGSVGRSYGSPPEMNLTWKEKQEVLFARSVRHEAWARFLKDKADTDGSGFVSTGEGRALRRRVEMALVAEQLRLGSIEDLFAAAPEASEEDLAAYSAMRAEAVRLGLEGMPPLPEGLDTAPR